MRRGIQSLAGVLVRSTYTTNGKRFTQARCGYCPYRSSSSETVKEKLPFYKSSKFALSTSVAIFGSIFLGYKYYIGKDDRELDLFFNALKKEIGTATMYLHQAEPQFAKPRFDAAFKMVESGLERKPGDPIPPLKIAYLMDQLGNIALQLECYKEAVQLYLATINGMALNGIERNNRAITELWLKVGQLSAILEDYRVAELSFMHCIEVTTAELEQAEHKNPDVIALAGLSYEGLGKLYVTMNHPDNAIHMYQHAIKFVESVLGDNDTHLPVLLSDVATVYESTGRYDLALENIDEAIRIAHISNPGVVAAVTCNKATIKMYSGKLEEARQLYEEVSKLCQARKDYETLNEVRVNMKILSDLESKRTENPEEPEVVVK